MRLDMSRTSRREPSAPAPAERWTLRDPILASLRFSLPSSGHFASAPPHLTGRLHRHDFALDGAFGLL
jgi:hypothetical protein